MDKGYKMEGDYYGQRQTTWFLCKYGITLWDIYRWLSTVCGVKTLT
jgi:hypothetical protein